MGGFKFEQCGNIEGLYLVEPQVFSDERGYNLEAYHAGSFREAGLDMVFVQDNLSMSAKGTLRGMHFQKNYQQGKLVCVVSGEVFAHGFLVLSDTAVFSYKLSDYYHPEDESGIPWNDETIGIRWPISKDMTILTSERDSRHPAFGEESALKPKKNRKTNRKQ